MRRFAKKSPEIIRVEENTLGSKAYEMTETGAVILIDKQYIYYNENPFLMNNKNKPKENICEIITQGYIHNTRGYCRSVLNSLKVILNNKKNKPISYWI